MSGPNNEPAFDPREILAAFQRAEAQFVVIGGLARVIRGADEVTYGVDVCPSLLTASGDRVQAALGELQAVALPVDGTAAQRDASEQQTIFEFNTAAGPLKIITAPDGVPRGYDALRSGASTEHLGGGLRPQVASTGDLITMAAARGLPEDLARIPELRRVLELEASPARLVASPGSGYELPPPTLDPVDRGVGPDL